jgi:hypothetical protein
MFLALFSRNASDILNYTAEYSGCSEEEKPVFLSGEGSTTATPEPESNR